MKVLVFGKTGQVARALAAQANVNGVTLEQHDRLSADLSNPEICADVIRLSDADAIINAAAWTNVDGAETEEAAANVINADAPGVMAQAAAERDLPFVHISTDYVFDGAEGPAWTPDDPTRPLGAYGRTKLAGEEAVLAAGGNAVILRTAWVFDGIGKNFVTTMLRLGAERNSLRVVADQVGGPTPADAIAAACLIIARSLRDRKGAPGIYHFSGAPDISWAGFARAIFKRTGQDVRVEDITTADYPTPARRPANSRLDCTSLEETFDINRPDWGAALDRILKERLQ